MSVISHILCSKNTAELVRACERFTEVMHEKYPSISKSYFQDEARKILQEAIAAKLAEG